MRPDHFPQGSALAAKPLACPATAPAMRVVAVAAVFCVTLRGGRRPSRVRRMPRCPPGRRGSRPCLRPRPIGIIIDAFNQNDNQLYRSTSPTRRRGTSSRTTSPSSTARTADIEEIYYFRWWTFRKHIKQTPDGFVITEFLPPVPWAGKYNTISCAAGHHLREGRWLNDPRYLDDYSVFWFRKGGDPRRYSFWAADAIWSRYLVTGDDRLAKELLPDLVANYEAWEKTRRDPNGLFWQVDGQDGMEVSISGALHPKCEGYRATINSYMYGDACAIAQHRRAGRPEADSPTDSGPRRPV